MGASRIVLHHWRSETKPYFAVKINDGHCLFESLITWEFLSLVYFFNPFKEGNVPRSKYSYYFYCENVLPQFCSIYAVFLIVLFIFSGLSYFVRISYFHVLSLLQLFTVFCCLVLLCLSLYVGGEKNLNYNELPHASLFFTALFIYVSLFISLS